MIDLAMKRYQGFVSSASLPRCNMLALRIYKLQAIQSRVVLDCARGLRREKLNETQARSDIASIKANSRTDGDLLQYRST